MSSEQVTPAMPAKPATPATAAVPAPAETGVRDYDSMEDGDWAEEPEELLPRRPRRRLLAPAPVALGTILMIACGFIGGVEVEKGQSSASGGQLGSFAGSALAGRGASTGRGSGSSRSGGSAGGSGGFAAGAGPAGAGGTVTAGEVSFVRGNMLYVVNGQGSTVKVTAVAGSKLTKTVSANVRDIHPGETVVVRGNQGRSGSIDASSISIGGGIGALLGGSGAGGRSSAREHAGAESSSSGGPALFGGN